MNKSLYILNKKASASLSKDLFLTNYWPLDNNQMLDLKGAANMIQGSATTFSTETNVCGKGSLSLNNGWTQVHAGNYFNSPEFTIFVWVYPIGVGNWARIIDLFNVNNQDNIVLALSEGTTMKPAMDIHSGHSGYTGNTVVVGVYSSQPLVSNQWQSLATTFNGTFACIYINGTLTGSTQQSFTLPSNYSRSNFYIGRSDYVGDGVSSSCLKNLRIYNKSLTQTQIMEIMAEGK
jgi:hypothetical protein